MAQIGIFRMSDASKAAGDQLRSWIDRGLLDPTNLNEFAAATNYSAKQIEALADQAKVAGSALPMFQQAMNDATSARKQLDSLMVEGMNVNRGFFVEFGQQLRQGANAWDAFKSAGINALGKIADKLMQMAADNLFANAFGGSSGGGFGGLLGGLGGLFGLGGSGSVPVMSSGLGAGTGGLSFPMFASGGFTGRGGKYEPAGIVHKGEYVMDAVTVRRVGVANLDSLRGYADGGLVGNMARSASGNNSGPQVTIVQHNDFSNSDPGSEARMRQYVDQSRKTAVQEAVQAVRTVQNQNPAYLRGGR